jgi:hypothetical protein
VPGDPDDAVIWEQVVARTGDDSRLSVSFQAFLTIACLLAAIGAVTNSPVTVVGAMVLGRSSARWPRSPSGWCCAAATWSAAADRAGRRFPGRGGRHRARRRVFAGLGLFTTADLDAGDQVDFIYSVGWFSLSSRCWPGRRACSRSRRPSPPRWSASSISVTTVPAAGYAAVAAGPKPAGRRSPASIGQLVVNLAGIAVAAVIVLIVARRSKHPVN